MQMIVKAQAARHKGFTELSPSWIGESKCFVLDGGRLMKGKVRVLTMIMLQEWQ